MGGQYTAFVFDVNIPQWTCASGTPGVRPRAIEEPHSNICHNCVSDTDIPLSIYHHCHGYPMKAFVSEMRMSNADWHTVTYFYPQIIGNVVWWCEWSLPDCPAVNVPRQHWPAIKKANPQQHLHPLDTDRHQFVTHALLHNDLLYIPIVCDICHNPSYRQ